jgi:succinate dehydrogenase/fumarate reductase flavoprotein subunit
MEANWDVIVVGGGGSGLAAALSAAHHGGRVLVLEKRPQLGGTTGIAVGSFTAAGTCLQQQAGIDDHFQQHVEDVALFAEPDIESRNNHSLRTFFLNQAADTFHWLQGLGLSFVGPHPEPPNRVPRMHNVVPGAKAYITAFQLALQKTTCQQLCGAQVKELLFDEGRVVGVVTEINNVRQTFKARRGVILAAGDYSNSDELIGRHKGPAFRKIEGINPHATGEGHQLAAQAGGKLVNMDVTYGPELRFVPSSKKPFQQWLPTAGLAARFLGMVARRLPQWCIRRFIKRLLVTWQHPENQLFEDGAILVNQHGNRFVNETRWPQRELAVATQEDKLAYILLDGRLIERYSTWPHFISTAPDIAYAYVSDYQQLRADVTSRADQLHQLARQRGIPADSLTKTVTEFNSYVRRDQPDPHGREGDPFLLEQGPWILLGPVKAYFTTTEGGAAVNQQLQVLDANDQPVPGLYAAGQNGSGGLILWSHGLHIAWALTSGRLAGQAIMAD